VEQFELNRISAMMGQALSDNAANGAVSAILVAYAERGGRPERVRPTPHRQLFNFQWLACLAAYPVHPWGSEPIF
jgi:hypothetical protein